MKITNIKEIIAKECYIYNVKIKNADIGIDDHGVLSIIIGVQGEGIGAGILITLGQIKSDYEYYKKPGAIISIINIFRVMGVYNLSDLKGKYARIAVLPRENKCGFLGNIISDEWIKIEEEG